MKLFSIFRLRNIMVLKVGLLSFILFIHSHANAQVPAGNYVRTFEAAAPEQDANALTGRWMSDVRIGTQYMDGLGRTVQTVIKQGSLETGNAVGADIVKMNTYDALGREQYQYMSFVSGTSDGSFKTDALQLQNTFSQAQYPGETNFYKKINFEPSPLSRAIEAYTPGSGWAGSETNPDPGQRKNTQLKYCINTLTDNVRIWTVINDPIAGNFGSYRTTASYPAGQLSKVISIDEHGKQVIEFKDKSGLTILKKVQLTAVADNGTGSDYIGWICTYYVYDDLNNLRCTILPKAVDQLAGPLGWQLTDATVLNELTFRSEYDARGRAIKVKSPGAGETWMVYDMKDRQVMKQDANLRKNHQWMYLTYDDLDRVISTGLITDPSNYNNLSYHLNAAYNSTAYPTIAAYASEELTNLFYDNYAWLNGYANPLPAVYNNSFDNYFNTASNTSWPYPQQNIQSLQVRGMATGSRTKILGTGNYLYNITFYDSKGRPIQSQSTNITGGTDIITTQYGWAGQSLTTVQKEDKLGSNAQSSVIVSQMSYDDLGRVTKTEKKISNSLVSGGAMPAGYTTTARMEYNKLGQLKTKRVGNKPNVPGAALSNSDYEYNIHGALTSVNGAYVENTTNDDRYFGMQLAYDKNALSGATVHQYNGAIGSIIWKSAGDQQKRKYDFNYDAANRLTGAVFGQYVSGAGQDAIYNTSAGIDFTVSNLAYDLNGNIVTMDQKGLQINQSNTIDQLVYTYIPNSNKLLNVFDAANNTATALGDFRFKPSHPQYSPKLSNTTPESITDYTYDDNGNVINDYNKGIKATGADGIIYNYLNLPQQVKVDGKGTITYTYGAGGIKLKAEAMEPAATVYYNGADYTSDITTTTTYNNGFVYEGKTYSNTSLAVLNTADVLQLAPQEEGRIRFKPALGNTPASLAYDYMLQDHLGNVRVVLTEEQQQDKYPIASLETAKLNIEKGYYDIQDGNIADRSEATGIPATGAPNYKNNNGIGNNPSDAAFEDAYSQKLYRLNSTGAKTGLGITLKVMAGDRIDVFGRSYYFTNNTGGPAANSNVPVTTILGGLLGGATGAAATSVHGPVEVGNINISSGTAGLSPMLSQQNSQSAAAPFDKPRAFINVIFFDEQFKAVAGNFRISMIGSNSEVKDHYQDLQNIIAGKSGYAYIYCSNESPVNVYFDNVQVVHTRSQILETNEYYPHGLRMAGISYKAAGTMKNPYQYQGQYSENEDWTQWNDFALRSYDAQLGRFMQQDPYAEFPSPYTGMANDPVNTVDPSGGSVDRPIDWFKGVCSGDVMWIDRTDDNFTAYGEKWENIGSGRWIDERETEKTIGIYSIKGHYIYEPGGRESFFRSNADIAMHGTDDIAEATMRAVPASGPTIWQMASHSDDFGARIVYGFINEIYITGQNINHKGWLTDLSGELVGAKERQVATLNTLQLPMMFVAAPENVAFKAEGAVTEGLTNSQLVQKSATLAERNIGGVGGAAGTAKHQYASELLNRYQRLYGSRGIETGVYFNNGVGNRGFLDVLDNANGIIYDFKFGKAVMSPAQYTKYFNNFGLPIQIIRP